MLARKEDRIARKELTYASTKEAVRTAKFWQDKVEEEVFHLRPVSFLRQNQSLIHAEKT